MKTKKTKKEERKKITIEIKKEIIQKYEKGVKQPDLCNQYDMSRSTIATIIKKADFYKELKVAKGTTIVSSRRNKVMEEMETLLLIWIKDIQIKGDSVSQKIICLKAQAIYKDLLQNLPSTSSKNDFDKEFKASKGWFERFKKRAGILSVVRQASAEEEAAENFVKEFEKLIEANCYRPENCEETEFLWKKKPKRTYITKEEKTLPEHKPIEDRLTLPFSANASSDLKKKPLLRPEQENVRDEEDENSNKNGEVLTSDIQKILKQWSELEELVKKCHPNQAVVAKATNVFNDNVINYFKRVLTKRETQTTIDMYFKPSSAKKQKKAIGFNRK